MRIKHKHATTLSRNLEYHYAHLRLGGFHQGVFDASYPKARVHLIPSVYHRK